MAGSANETIRGPVGLLDEYTSLRINDKDQAKLPIYRYRGQVPFIHTLLFEKTQKRPVTDIKFTNYEQEEETNTMTMKSGTSISGASMTIGIEDAAAKFLQQGTYLVNENINYSYSAGYTKPALIQSVTQSEMAKVISVGGAGSHSSGYTNVVLMRMHQWTGGASTAFDAAGGTWAGSTDSIKRVSRSTFDGASSGIAVSMNPTGIDNYLQIFEKPYEVTELDQNVRKFSVEDPFAYVGKKATLRMVREMEQHFLLYGYGGEGNTAGRAEPTTNSLVWAINQAVAAGGSNRAAITEDTINAFNLAVRPLSEISKSNRLYVFCGSPFLLRFNQLFASYLTESPLSGNKYLGITVPQYTDPLGVQYLFLYSREMSVSEHYKNSGLIANFDYLNYAYLKGDDKSFDIYVDRGDDGAGLQARDQKTKKYQVRAIAGLEVNYYEAHGEVYFPY